MSVQLRSKTDRGVVYEVSENYCSCPSWKFSKEPLNMRRCKHIIAVFGKGRVLKNSTKKEAVVVKPMLLTENINVLFKKAGESLVYSRKFNGIRIVVRRGHLYTRTGVLLSNTYKWKQLTKLFQKDLVYDGELVTKDVDASTHTSVMAAIINDDPGALTVRIFDEISRPNESFHRRYNNLLNSGLNHSLIVRHVPVQSIDHLKRVVHDAILNRKYEGVVVRSTMDGYHYGKRFSRFVKIKRLF